MIKRIDHIGIIVDDLEEARKFFTQTLMLTDRKGWTRPNLRTWFITCGDLSIELIQIDDESERQRRLGDRIAQIEHVAFDVDDLEGAASELRSRGMHTTADIPQESPSWNSYWSVPSTSAGVVCQILMKTDDSRSHESAGVPKPGIVRFGESTEVNRGDGVRSRQMVGGGAGPRAGVTSGYTDVDPGSAVLLHSHNCPEVVVVLEGNGTLECAGELYRVDRGDAATVPVGSDHRLINEGPERLRILWTYVSDRPTRTLADSGVTVSIGPDESGSS